MSLTEQAGQTAYGPMVVVAVEQYEPSTQRLVDDGLARQFLPSALRQVLRMARLPVLRRALLALSERRAPGVRGSVLCRKRYIDDKALGAVDEGIGTVVNLGAGLDTRAYRLPGMARLAIYEADLPANVAYKGRVLDRLYGGVPAHVRLVPADLGARELPRALHAAGYRAGERSFFICEAVTQYLPESGMREILAFLAGAASGSRIVFTYIRQDFIDGAALYGLDTLYRGHRVKQQLWQRGLAPEEVAPLLSEHGWREVEQVGTREYEERYLEPIGRALAVTPIERAVHAERL